MLVLLYAKAVSVGGELFVRITAWVKKKKNYRGDLNGHA
jgi:hypothetical protein